VAGEKRGSSKDEWEKWKRQAVDGLAAIFERSDKKSETE
jgi:hypothetical protein